MADRIVKPDTGNDLVLQNDDASAKMEVNEDGTIVITTSLVSLTGDFKVGGNDIQDSGGVVCFTFDGSGNTNMADKILQRPEIKDYGESVNAIGTPSDPQNIDLTLGNVVLATLGVGTGG